MVLLPLIRRSSPLSDVIPIAFSYGERGEKERLTRLMESRVAKKFFCSFDGNAVERRASRSTKVRRFLLIARLARR